MSPSDDSFYGRIPTLPDAELLEYVRNCSRYRLEAVQIALKTLESRGYLLKPEELDAVEAFFHSKSGADVEPLQINTNLFRWIAAVVLGIGLLISALIYFTASPVAENPLGMDVMDTKAGMRQLELYGGKSNVLATQLNQWFAGLWHGQALGLTIALISVVIAAVLLLISLLGTPKNDSGK